MSKRTRRQTNKGKKAKRLAPIGVDEPVSVDDVYYSPKFIEKLEAEGVDTTNFLKANGTAEDELVRIIFICMYVSVTYM